ncbi:mitochondrial inner membrane protease subunit 1 isoform 2-T2 [Macrochelys suwanniensis]
MRPPSCKYINRKGYFSIVFQALVDHRGHFMDINAGCSEKVHDACIFWNTGLFRKLQAGTFFLDQKITVREVEMPIMILGDPAYPLKPYMGHLDSRKERFNNRLIYQQRLELWMTELDTVFQQHSHQCQLQRVTASQDRVPHCTVRIIRIIRYLSYKCVQCSGPSMEPTIQNSDIVFSENLSRHFYCIQKGDIVIAKSPNDPKSNICKRVIGLEGDKVCISSPSDFRKSHSYVPKGHVWLEGDNLRNSTDSRCYGPVPYGLIRGRICFKLWKQSF